MSERYPIPFPLPDDEQLDEWQRIVKQQIIEMQKNPTPYQWRKGKEHDGTTATYYHKSFEESSRRKIFSQSRYSYCCGATGELFLRCWRQFNEGYEDEVTGEQMFTLLRYYFFRRTDLGSQYLKGAMNGLKWLSDQSSWLEVHTSEDPNNMPFGTFIQFDFSGGTGRRGHAAVVVGHGKVGTRDVLFVWSSNKKYPKNCDYTRNQPDGHGFDYFYKNQKNRKFYGAWVVP